MTDIINIAPMDIEKESFATITRELGEKQPPAELAPIVKRVIHTTADFEYAETLYFSPGVVEQAKAAIRGGAHIVTDTTMGMSGAILTEAGLSFLGLGDPNIISWGQMIYAGKPYITSAWWLSTFPGLAAIFTVLVFYLLGDGLNHVLDPKYSKKR